MITYTGGVVFGSRAQEAIKDEWRNEWEFHFFFLGPTTSF